ncbi:meiosis inhibitor protein 1-like [Tachypleus tridentatus]|uniref:meiosis inhibitor protein 1-like n=1 Tax=Tachypleus tridentatus TaxID=6853 RepID=UPI003FD54717
MNVHEESYTSYRTLLRDEHTSHGDRWLIEPSNTSSDTDLCLACIILTLEDETSLSCRKRFLLSIVLGELRHEGTDLAKTLASEIQVTLQLSKTLLDLLFKNDESLHHSAAEGILMLRLLNLELSEWLVLDELIRKIQEDCSYQKSLVPLHLVGKLVHTVPSLSNTITHAHVGFLHYLSSGLSHPSDEIKAAIIFILTQVYSTWEDELDPGLRFHVSVVKGLLLTLKNTQSKDVQINSVALLQQLVQREFLLSISMEIQVDGSTLTSILKKLLLLKDSSLQVAVVQCICVIVFTHKKSAAYVETFLSAGLPEFFYETLSTSNELLVELASTEDQFDQPFPAPFIQLVFWVHEVLRVSPTAFESTSPLLSERMTMAGEHGYIISWTSGVLFQGIHVLSSQLVIHFTSPPSLSVQSVPFSPLSEPQKVELHS